MYVSINHVVCLFDLLVMELLHTQKREIERGGEREREHEEKISVMNKLST